MRAGMTGTTAEADSMSSCMPFDTTSTVACAWVSRTEIRPMGLSSRMVSPVSVIQAVVVRLANVMSTRKAGVGRPPASTTSRLPMASCTAAFFMVAGSNTIHSRRVPATRPSLARRRPRLNIKAGGSASSRVSLRVPLALTMLSASRKPSRRPRTVMGPVPGSSENSKVFSANVRSTVADVRRTAAVVAPSSENCSRPSSRNSKPSSVRSTWLTVKPIFSPR